MNDYYRHSVFVWIPEEVQEVKKAVQGCLDGIEDDFEGEDEDTGVLECRFYTAYKLLKRQIYTILLDVPLIATYAFNCEDFS